MSKDNDDTKSNIEENSFRTEVGDLNDEFEENKWGKEDGGTFIIDGYTFKGKQAFKKAKEGLAKFLKKGLQSEVGGLKFKVLDTRIKGVGQEIDVEISEKSKRGVAVLKLYGPNKTKGYVVMVNKSKGSDNEFVILLAEKIVKPLMRKYLSADGSSEEEEPKKPQGEESSKSPFQCPQCKKVLNSLSGLKSHITKMHKKNGTAVKETIVHDKRKADDEVLLSDTNEIDVDINLEETCGTEVNEKKYKNKCDDCDFKVVANRKYELIQVILRHKETCTSAKLKPLQKIKTCDVCEYVGKDEGNLKRHKRDKHDILTVSISPPPKKTK